MKKCIYLFVLLMFLVTGCSDATTSQTINTEPPLVSNDSKVTAKPTDANPIPSPTTPTSSPTPTPIPVKDEEILKAVMQNVADNFSTTTWFPYIQNIWVYECDGIYTGEIIFTETPYDYSLSLLMPKYFSEKEAQTITPILLDAGVALNLDDIDLCLVAESLSKIYKNQDLKIAFNSLNAYDIPVYKYFADAIEVSVTDIKDNLHLLHGAKAVNVILNGLSSDYEGSFTGLSISKAETASRVAMDRRTETYISEIIALSADGKKIGTYDNRVPKPQTD